EEQREPGNGSANSARGLRGEACGGGDLASNPGELVPRVEFLRALGARRRATRSAMTVGEVPGGTGADPGRELFRGLAVVGGAADVADLSRDPTPRRAVSGAVPGQCVRDLVQQHLMDLVVLESRGEIARHRD